MSKIIISLVNVSREEQQELRDYLEKNCWLWVEVEKEDATKTI